MAKQDKVKLAVWKFSSCDGCQLSLLDCEDELLLLCQHVDIAYFLEATSYQEKGPYDLSLIEGSITTAHDQQRIQEVRRMSKYIVTIGACATGGGIQALRNFTNVRTLLPIVYPKPEYISTLDQSTPISDHIKVDFELQGCPINKLQLLELISAILNEKKPAIPTFSTCVECKQKGNVCVMIAQGIPCLGPVTQAGCAALCPSYNRGCYGCFGPMENANSHELANKLSAIGMSNIDLVHFFRTFNAWRAQFREVSERHERQS
jgi:sulfhydrogenase subunit delta